MRRSLIAAFGMLVAAAGIPHTVALAQTSSGRTVLQPDYSQGNTSPTYSGSEPMQPAWRPASGSDRVREVQQQLESAGIYHGPQNGVLDAATRGAISQYQQQHGLLQTGTLNRQSQDALQRNQAGRANSQ